MLKMLILIAAIFFFECCTAQDSLSKYDFEIKHGPKKSAASLVPASDSLNIFFLYNYQPTDTVLFQTKHKSFVVHSFERDNFYGIAATKKIAKKDLGGPVTIFFNRQRIGTLRIKKRFSLAHLEIHREKHGFTWRYHKYRFSFL